MLVADVFMDNIEDEIVHSSPHSRCIRLWRRYADDILCVWNGTYLQANDLLRTLNNSGPAMIFTLENGGSKTNYLNLEISPTER